MGKGKKKKRSKVELEYVNDEVEVETQDRCRECGKGHLEYIDLGIRKLIICDICDYRKVIK